MLPLYFSPTDWNLYSKWLKMNRAEIITWIRKSVLINFENEKKNKIFWNEN